MTNQMFKIIVVFSILWHSALTTFNEQPPYQVSVMCTFHPGNEIHCCNGAIIYEKLIICTAKCVHFQFGPKGKPNRLDPSVLSVIAGSTNAFTDAIRVDVSEIYVAPNFDSKTLDNDVALLILKKSLPLGERPDIKWIMLDDSVHVNHSCLANFFSRSTNNAMPNYYQTEELMLYNNEICRNFTDYPNARKSDICSTYVLPQQFDCPTADTFLSFNSDRGTGLVCKSYLVGLLSSVVSRPTPENNCSDVSLAAIYTNIFPHLMWIYTIMANIETQYTSTPYDATLKSLVINTTYNNKEILTTTILPPSITNVTRALNSTSMGNSTTTGNSTIAGNSTIIYPTLSNSTINSTALNPTMTNFTTNSTTLNSTAINTTSINPTMINTTPNSTTTSMPLPKIPITWNSTVHTTPPTAYTVPRTFPKIEPTSTDSYVKDPPPTIRNYLKNNAAPVKCSSVSLLIALISLRLIIYH